MAFIGYDLSILIYSAICKNKVNSILTSINFEKCYKEFVKDELDNMYYNL